MTGLLGDNFVVGGRGVGHKLKLAAVQVIHDFSLQRPSGLQDSQSCVSAAGLGVFFARGGSIPLGGLFLFSIGQRSSRQVVCARKWPWRLVIVQHKCG
jgi:hypothetical protein